MGLLFGGSTVENEEKIDELKTRVEEAESVAADAKYKAQRARRRSRENQRKQDELEEKVEMLEDFVAEAAQPDFDFAELPNVSDKSQELQTLDEPRKAYKATDNGIVRLVIPEGAKIVHSPYGSKKRASAAIVYDIHDAGEAVEDVEFGVPNVDLEGSSRRFNDTARFDGEFEYTIGELVEPEGEFDPDTGTTCSSGIHFYCDLYDAAHYFY